MRRTATAILAATLLAIGAGQIASAADLPRQQPAYLPPPLPAYMWTGCYIGANIGGAWGHVEATDVNTGATVSPNNGGFAGGGQIGCDYQMSQWVIGIRNVFDGTSINNGATISDPLFAGTINSHVHWFDALTARGGYLVQPNILLYAQGGAAWTSWDVTAFNTVGAQVGQISGGNRTGWTVGGGVEWMFVPHWSVFLEYNFMGFGTRSATTTACVGATCANVSAKADLQNVLVGVNYKF
jgi:outer membrane immunogenic protein